MSAFAPSLRVRVVLFEYGAFSNPPHRPRPGALLLRTVPAVIVPAGHRTICSQRRSGFPCPGPQACSAQVHIEWPAVEPTGP